MNKKLFFWFLLFVWVGGSIYGQPTMYIDISNLGLTPNTRENAIPYVQKAIEICKQHSHAVLVFPKGRYDFWSPTCQEKFYYESNTDNRTPKQLAMLFEQMQNLIVEANGSEFIFHGKIQPFTIDHSQNITLRNFSIDWEIPLSAEAEVIKNGNDFVDLSIDDRQFPFAIEDGKLFFVGEGWKSEWWGMMEFDRQTGFVVPETGDQGCLRNEGDIFIECLPTNSSTPKNKTQIRLHGNFSRTPATGNYLVLRHNAREHAGIFVIESKDITIENVNMYHNGGLGILAQYSENLTCKKVHCIPNPDKRKVLSGHDDGLQVSNCRGKILVDSCDFYGLMDDPINIHGTSVKVAERLNARTLRCYYMANLGLNWARAGDKVALIDAGQMKTTDYRTVKEIHFLDSARFDLTFTEPLPEQVSKNYALENLTWTCQATIQNSWFGSCRARGLLVSTPGKVVIQNNVFESSGAAILIAGDANFWYESGAVQDVLISHNVFKKTCMSSLYQFCEGIISIYPEIPKINDSTPPFHRNIQITDNEFHPFDYPILYALSVNGLLFANNKLIRAHDNAPFHHRKYGLTFAYCKKITVKGNTEEGNILGKYIQRIHTPTKECRVDKKDCFKL
ncbi:MAG: right-handed parallel beta-helix repeat-containing protein [Bacteroidales bacterium]|jgi:hypothetical protein|nr:right-handed parallel beta-helix repeat-containing protein [Bacteroidales bacterium]